MTSGNGATIELKPSLPVSKPETENGGGELPNRAEASLKGKSLEGEGGPDDIDNSRVRDQSFQDRTLVDNEDDGKPAEQNTATGLSVSPVTTTSKADPPSSSDRAADSNEKEDSTMYGNEPWAITSWNPAGSPSKPTAKHNSWDYQPQDVGTTFIIGEDTQDGTPLSEKRMIHKEGDRAAAAKPASSSNNNVEDSSDFLGPLRDSQGDHYDSTRTGDLPKPSPTPTPTVSRRPSALQLRPPSPQPWDLVTPPKEMHSTHLKAEPLSAGMTRSPSASQRFGQIGPGRTLIPKSSYYFGPPPSDSAFGTPPVGRIGVHHPREIIRVERDYTGGEVIQFAPVYPLELENRLTPTQFLESINSINEVLISAHSLRRAFVDNVITVMSLQLSRLFLSTHLQKELKRLKNVIEDLNVMLFNPVGLNILWPGDVAFLFLEIEYY